jgi:hypothetical protein
MHTEPDFRPRPTGLLGLLDRFATWFIFGPDRG